MKAGIEATAAIAVRPADAAVKNEDLKVMQ